MNTPMYTPFFIHPTQKKRITRKRNLLNQEEEGYTSMYEPRTRRSVVSGEWAPETSIVAYHTRSKRQVDSEREMRQKNSSEGIHDVAAEVEVNVEDDIGESDSPPPKQIYAIDGSNSDMSKNSNLQLSGNSDVTRQFNPENCTDLLELRSRLYAACDRIESLTRLNISMSKLKQENNFLKNELSKRDTRIAQLESIVLERNMRLKQLLSENVLMSARIKRIQSEFGVDAVKEIFNRDKYIKNMATDSVYSGCEGPNAAYVKLISSDGHEFIIKRSYALTSGTIKAMLSGPGQYTENEANEVHFREIPSHVLQKVCHYFNYKVRYTNSATEIPEFQVSAEISLELLMAANFLDC